MKRREFMGLVGGAAVAWPMAARAQQQPRVWRVGYLAPSSPSDINARTNLETLRLKLRELGYVEGRNLILYVRRAEGDFSRLPDLAAELVASTSGTDSDWVVKLIDVYPDDAKDMAGFQLMIASEILRARYRHSFERPEAVPAGKPQKYMIDLHTNAHAFLKGHRIMVQVQSTLFPVYDRNPQKFVANIFEAHAADYVKATQRVYRGSAVVLPVVK